MSLSAEQIMEMDSIVTSSPTKKTNTAIPLAGGIVGGAIGSLLGPAGTIAGAGIGAGAGTVVDDLLNKRPQSQYNGGSKNGFKTLNKEGAQQSAEDFNRGIKNVGTGMAVGSGVELLKEGGKLAADLFSKSKAAEKIANYGTHLRKDASKPVGKTSEMSYQNKVQEQTELKKQLGFLGSPTTSSVKASSIKDSNNTKIEKFLKNISEPVKTKDLTSSFTKIAKDQGLVRQIPGKKISVIADPDVKRAMNIVSNYSKTKDSFTYKELNDLANKIGNQTKFNSNKPADVYLKSVYFEIEKMIGDKAPEARELVKQNGVLRQLIQSWNSTSAKGGNVNLGIVKVPTGQAGPTIKDWLGASLEKASKKNQNASQFLKNIESSLSK